MLDKSRIIPKKNYLYLLTILAIVIVICSIVLYAVIGYRNNQIKKSYLSRTIGEVQYDELETAFIEQGTDNFLYIGYTGSFDIYNMEVKLKKIIVNNNLQDNMFYLNATELMKEDNYISKLNTELKLSGDIKLIELPAILYYKNNKVIDLITSSSSKVMINDGDFTQLLEKYEIIN